MNPLQSLSNQLSNLKHTMTSEQERIEAHFEKAIDGFGAIDLGSNNPLTPLVQGLRRKLFAIEEHDCGLPAIASAQKIIPRISKYSDLDRHCASLLKEENLDREENGQPKLKGSENGEAISTMKQRISTNYDYLKRSQLGPSEKTERRLSADFDDVQDETKAAASQISSYYQKVRSLSQDINTISSVIIDSIDDKKSSPALKAGKAKIDALKAQNKTFQKNTPKHVGSKCLKVFNAHLEEVPVRELFLTRTVKAFGEMMAFESLDDTSNKKIGHRISPDSILDVHKIDEFKTVSL